jgi:SAM-dependent methyltransferase
VNDSSAGFRCRACDGLRTTPRFTVDGYDLVRCGDCGSLNTAWRMTTDAAAEFYGERYFCGVGYRDYEGSADALRENFRRFADRLTAYESGGRLLELGCAYGFFLEQACHHWDCEGVDISPDVVDACRRRTGCRVFAGDLAELDLQREAYRWVVAWDVVEHLDRPRAFVARAFDLLAPGGRVAFTTGDISSFAARALGSAWRLLTPPDHLTFFSRQGMRKLLGDAGFVDCRFATAGYTRTFDFAIFRLFGRSRYAAFTGRFPALVAAARRHSFYVNLGDIMFVTARKSDGR